MNEIVYLRLESGGNNRINLTYSSSCRFCLGRQKCDLANTEKNKRKKKRREYVTQLSGQKKL